MATVDLNADMGESYGPWKMGNDDILLDIVTSANIACGFHAGDPNIMLSTMKMAAEKDVGIGAHPGFHDIEEAKENKSEADKHQELTVVDGRPKRKGAAEGQPLAGDLVDHDAAGIRGAEGISVLAAGPNADQARRDGGKDQRRQAADLGRRFASPSTASNSSQSTQTIAFAQ